MTDRHILAIGGLIPEANNASIVDYCLKLTDKEKPSLGFIGTASGDAVLYRGRFEALAAELDCDASTLPFFARTPDVAEWVTAQDVILVGGGNTKSMLAVWREWGLTERLREAWESGTVLTGWSAGAICWFEQGVTDSFADRLDALDCLGFLPGSCCPHYSGEVDRRPAYESLVKDGLILQGIALDDGAGVHFVNDQPQAVVATTANANAYSVSRTGDDAMQESPLDLERVELSML